MKYVRVFKTITQDAAEAVVKAAREAAAKLESGVYKPAKTKMHVHVLGREGTLMAASQANGAWPGSDDIATRKARTVLGFGFPSRAIGELSRPEMAAKAPLYGIELSNHGLITFPGGIPLHDADGNLVGAIGVSGDTVDLDEKVALAGAEAFKTLKNATIDLPALTESAAVVIAAAARAKAEATDSGMLKDKDGKLKKARMFVKVIGVDGSVLGATGAEDAWQGSNDISLLKAKTALLFKLPTRVIGELSRADKESKGPLYGIEVSNCALISFPGGLPLFDAQGNCVGAIGVSGDTVDVDEIVAQAGVDEFKALLK